MVLLCCNKWNLLVTLCIWFLLTGIIDKPCFFEINVLRLNVFVLKIRRRLSSRLRFHVFWKVGRDIISTQTFLSTKQWIHKEEKKKKREGHCGWSSSLSELNLWRSCEKLSGAFGICTVAAERRLRHPSLLLQYLSSSTMFILVIQRTCH